ncbi:MAG: tRNA guanosine(34) transglycosylase Tgt [Anaerolineaceae bacterium]|nr:tRNA guanosine(34) transglycosylase Tgt [Anaerolineaceae bacterium]
MTELFQFNIEARSGKARAGRFHTRHGDIITPIFAPVGTQATVKGITTAQLSELGANLVLSNTYHLHLRPGEDLVAEMGGLHEFMQWHGPMLTDSGGFQVFSLSKMRKIDEDGVNFRSYIDGSKRRFTPESSIAIQEKLGADIMMAFDECAPPYDYRYSKKAMDRTHRWALRSKEAQTRGDMALFGIVQGGIFADLREESARAIAEMDFPGNAIGGLSVGETKEEMNTVLNLVNDILPKEKPRYLMGVGSPEDIVNGILRGVDIFDCVLPTRLARHKAAMTFNGQINLQNAVHARDPRPIDEECTCYTCQHFTRAYLRHLFVAKESLSGTLVSIHNIHTLLELVRRIRQAIFEDRFEDFASEFLANYQTK